MRLYVANPTRQLQLVFYRPDIFADNRGFTPPAHVPIKPGQQAQVGGDLEKGQIDNIEYQLKRHGFLWEMEIPNNLTGVCPYIGQIDRPVSSHTIQMVLDHNSGVKIDEGERRRRAAAIGANEALKLATLNADVPEPPEFDMEVEQMEQTEAGEKRIEEGFHVVKDISRVPKRPGPRPRNKVS